MEKPIQFVIKALNHHGCQIPPFKGSLVGCLLLPTCYCCPCVLPSLIDLFQLIVFRALLAKICKDNAAELLVKVVEDSCLAMLQRKSRSRAEERSHQNKCQPCFDILNLRSTCFIKTQKLKGIRIVRYTDWIPK